MLGKEEEEEGVAMSKLARPEVKLDVLMLVEEENFLVQVRKEGEDVAVNKEEDIMVQFREAEEVVALHKEEDILVQRQEAEEVVFVHKLEKILAQKIRSKEEGRKLRLLGHEQEGTKRRLH